LGKTKTRPSISASERKAKPQLTSAATQTTVAEVNSGKIKITGKARIGILYYTDRPAHRDATLKWFKDNQGEVTFENQKYGYLEASIDWAHLGKLIATAGNLGLDEASLMKLELDSISAEDDTGSTTPANANANPCANGASSKANVPGDPAGTNSYFIGPVHSAGYGAHVDEFRAKAASDLGLSPADLNGKGTVIAVFDGGIDLSRTDVYGDRIRDFVVGEDASYLTAEQTLADFMKAEKATVVPKGLEDLETEPTLRFTTLDESPLKADLNGSGTKDDSIAVAVYMKDGHPEARFRPFAQGAFGDAVADLGLAHQKKTTETINLYTGNAYSRSGASSPSPSAVAVKFKTDSSDKIQVAFIGVYPGADHGIANLHMAGGDFVDGAGKIKYQGVATGAEFIGAQPWKIGQIDYGTPWLSLARTIMQSADAGADVLDLDIYTPGIRGGNDLLSNLLCRVTSQTHAVPVVAAHNYGPLPDTIQSLAQSPCVLGIGASHSAAAFKYGRADGAISPNLTQEDQVQTASYSGRGFGMNGMLKPDIISPAYGYTAYGEHFTRFAGTSGATPTTAGMIAIFKQAARKKGVELGFDQMKFLLQASSTAVDPAQARDGYGFTNLAAAWELFKQSLDQSAGGTTTRITPFQLTGQTRISFDGRPTEQSFSANITRVPLPGGEDTAAPMKFWVEYGGASAYLNSQAESHWLKFYDTSSGKLSDTMDWEAPMNGESQAIKFVIDLPDEAWNALPPGDHIAIIKGVRKSLATGRNVDFMQPVTFTKVDVVDETTYTIHPLYAEQYQIFNIATLPGEKLLVQARPECNGTQVSLNIRGDNAAAPFLVIDNEARYDHASNVMNTYEPLSLDPGSFSITAAKKVVRIGVIRYRLDKCDGPMSGTLTVRRLGFDVQTATPSLTRTADTEKADVTATIQLKAEPLAEQDLDRDLTWTLKKGDSTLILRKVTTEETTFTLPKGVTSVKVSPKDSGSRFVGFLTSQKLDEKDKSLALDESLVTSGAYQGGFKPDGILQLASPSEGEVVRYSPGTTESKAKAPVIIEVIVNLPDAIDVTMDKVAPITNWPKDGEQTAQLHIKAPLARPDSLKDFAPSDWTTTVRIPLSIHESSAHSTRTAQYLDQTLWTGNVDVAL
jgi:hypothetical protein